MMRKLASPDSNMPQGGGDPGAAPCCLVADMRDVDAPFLLEWLCYHRLIGVGQILLRPDRIGAEAQGLLDALEAAGEVTLIAAGQSFPAPDAGMWQLGLAVDEFLQITIGDGTLVALSQGQVPGAAPLPRQLFGPGAALSFTDALQISRFTDPVEPAAGEQGPDAAAPCHVNHYATRDCETYLLTHWTGEGVDLTGLPGAATEQRAAARDLSLRDWAARVMAARADLYARHGAIADQHQAAVAAHRGKIAALRRQLAQIAPEQEAQLFAPPAAQLMPSEAGRADLVLPPAGVASPWLKPILPLSASARRVDQEHVHMSEGFVARFVARGQQRLVIAFDSQLAVRPDPRKLSLGADAARRHGWSYLRFQPRRAHWYRDPALLSWLHQMMGRGVFAGYEHVTLIGHSMGGYAACALTGLFPGAQVLAFSPQSSLAPGRALWDRRFPQARREDWSGEFADAARAMPADTQGWLIYDPFEQADRQHVQHLRRGHRGLEALPLSFCGHHSALRLQHLGLLDSLAEALILGRMDRAGFREVIRSVRRMPWFAMAVAAKIRRQGRPAQLQELARIFAGFGHEKLAADLAAQARQMADETAQSDGPEARKNGMISDD